MTEAEIMILKEIAAEKTGVPAELITGKTVEEIAASATALAEYKRDSYEAAPTREKFAAWLNGDTPTEQVTDLTPAVPDYPNVPDGGEPQGISIRPSDPVDAFKEWLEDVTGVVAG